ncbi:MAG: hypothetical protein JRJ79_18200 [Deltaproteobacteria bacterium]|nr:hypothetical protein [Deltaproteobacteria bacterium]
MTCYAFAGGLDDKWKTGIESYNPDAEYAGIRALTEHLLREFADSGKTFIIKNWKGDWHLLGSYDSRLEPTPNAIAAMASWLKARCQAVHDARQSVRVGGVQVLSAVEFNLVVKAQRGGKTLLTEVLPHLQADLYSYSAWDSISSPRSMLQRLDFIKKYAPDSEAFGNNNLIIGELGCPNSYPDKLFRLRLMLSAFKGRGVPYVFFWQLYDNECAGRALYPVGAETRRQLKCRGYWLIDPLGRKTPSWYLIKKILASGQES